MRMLLTIPALLLAGGCAAPLTVTPQQMAVASNFDVCRYTMMGGTLAPAAQGEANRRGLDCAPIYNAIAAQRANEAAALNNAARYFNPQPAPLPRTIHCDSYRTGNWVDTTCR